MLDSVNPAERAHALYSRAILQVWLSPSFPVGAYAYSHGLEQAVEFGWIRDRDSLEAWLDDLCTCGSLRNDLILLAAAYSALDNTALGAIAELSAALQPTAERLLEATQQGASFLQQHDASWPSPRGAALAVRFDTTKPTLAVALGAAAYAHELQVDDTLAAYAIAFVSGLVSAAIRLGVVGQTDGQRIMAALLPVLAAEAAAARTKTLDDLGSAAFRSDVASMLHETQHTRLFRS
jgi:urease accessory protein